MQSRFKILMVDDIVRYHGLYEAAIVEALFAQVKFAKDGLEALAILSQEGPFDLVILDLSMPKMSGEEVLKKIRSDSDYDHMPVVILTGHSDENKQHQLLDLGADDFIVKGAPPETFVARIKSQLRYRMTLEKLSRLAVDMDIFAAGVLHDIRNLETSIIAVCTLMDDYLEDSPLESKGQMVHDLELLIEKAERLGRYANEVMQVVRQTSTGIKMEPQDIHDTALWAIDMADPLHQVSCEFADSLVPVLADRHFLQLAILNMVNNTIKYRRQDSLPRLLISQKIAQGKSLLVQGSQTQGMRVITLFRDYGRGISPHDLDRVFEPFVRGSDSKKDGGFGLGLSLVAKVIQTMGGRIWAEPPAEGPGVVIGVELAAAPLEKPISRR